METERQNKISSNPRVRRSATLGIHFGALADPIAKQLKKQGFKYKVEDVMHFEKQLDAITRLKFASLIADNVAKKAYDKLYKNIQRHVMKVNKLTKVA